MLVASDSIETLTPHKSLRIAACEDDGHDWGWFPDWTGETVAVVASGPSASLVDLPLLRGRVRVVAVNRAHELVPFADMVYGCDAAWWRSVNGLPDWPALKVSQDKHIFAEFPDIKRVVSIRGCQFLQLQNCGYIIWGGNSGSQAINLAAQTGARKIVLCGFDMTTKNGIHFHGPHIDNLPNPREPSVELWRRRTDSMADFLHEHGYTLANCSPGTALKKWPQMSLEDALADRR